MYEFITRSNDDEEKTVYFVHGINFVRDGLYAYNIHLCVFETTAKKNGSAILRPVRQNTIIYIQIPIDLVKRKEKNETVAVVVVVVVASFTGSVKYLLV